MERVGQNLRPVLFDFARYDGNGFLHQSLNVGLLIAQHVDGAAGVEAADNHIDPGSAKLPGQIECPGKLVGLDPHQPHDELSSRTPAPADNLSDRKAFRSFVKGDDLYPKVAEYTAVFHLFRYTVPN